MIIGADDDVNLVGMASFPAKSSRFIIEEIR
jgi:hypothetical protein